MDTRVATTACRRIVPSWSKKARVGMKYPASMMIGGRMTVKNRWASNSMISFWSLLKYVITPRMIPITIRRQLSGQRFSRRLLAWKPAPFTSVSLRYHHHHQRISRSRPDGLYFRSIYYKHEFQQKNFTNTIITLWLPVLYVRFVIIIFCFNHATKHGSLVFCRLNSLLYF